MDIPTSPHAEAADGLAMAVIATSNAPILLLDGLLGVIAVSSSFGEAFQIDPALAGNRPFSDLGEGEWRLPQLRSLLKATAAGLADIESYEMDLVRAGRMTRRLVINARRLDYADSSNVRLVVAVSDVTDVRINEKLKDDLLRDKTILLRELEHRVANSLQIIASVLMQSARKVRSQQARGHLRDARNRVMSIATMQRQLAASQIGEVVLRTYFTDLCDSIGASMISDHDQISLELSVDDSSVEANVSVSLGLIVTELVINALKHAFPHHRKGRILVSYKADGPNWMLTVHDTGVGMPGDHSTAKPGLGTGIVEALAKQLDASFRHEPANPGTLVTIARE